MLDAYPNLFSQALAHLGFLGLSGTLALSARSVWLDRAFGGLNRAFHFHHWLATLSLMLILVHVAIEVRAFGWALEVVRLYLTDWALASGWIALMVFGLVFLAAKKRQWPHRWWLWLHLLSVPAWLLAGYHLVEFSEFSPLKGLGWLSLALGGLGLLRSQILPRTPFWGTPYEISQVTGLNHQVNELKLSPLDQTQQLQPTRPAQYYYLRFRSRQQSRVWHPFTCLSAPGSPELLFAIKARGRDTRVIAKMERGMRVDVVGPFGGHKNLTESKGPASPRQLWFVAGVGVTPLISASRASGFAESSPAIVHAVDGPEDQIYPDHWGQLQQQGVHYELWVTNDRGYISLEKVKELIEGDKGAVAFVAGPDPFIEHVRQLLLKLNFPKNQIFTEEFVRK